MLTPHVRAIGRPAGPAQDDAVDPARVEGTPAALKSDLIQLVGQDQVLHRVSDLVRYASDASPYRYLPQVVVLPRTVDDVRAILAYCARTGRHATFRAGGTSLNGQSQSDDILIDVRRHWAGLVVEDGGARLRARPGTILGQANAVLRRVGRRLGPDPASADVATIGGVIANNAGGMRCTLERNAYHTVSSLTLVLASGTVIDTAAPGAEAAFAAAEPELAAGLLQLRSELLADERARPAGPPQVHHPQHQRLRAVGPAGRRYPAGDLPPAHRRIRGNARVHGGGRDQHHSGAGQHDGQLDRAAVDQRSGRAGPRPGRKRRRSGGAHARPRAGRGRAGLPRHPGVLAGSRSARRGAAGGVPRGQPGRARRRGSPGRRARRRREPGPPPGIHPRRGPDRVVLAGPRRAPRHRRTAAPRRYRPDHRGRVLPAGPHRRGRPGSAGPAVQAQLPAERRRARRLRQPALHADPQARRPR